MTLNFRLGLFHKVTSFAVNQTTATTTIGSTTDSSVATGGSTTQEPCVTPFQMKGGYCYFVEDTVHKSWQNAENICLAKGPNVHLASLETPQVTD